jgi:thiamine-phosphate pyrophosphorylase
MAGKRFAMASRGEQGEPRRPDPRLYLIAPAIADPGWLAGKLAQALGAADVAAVLLPVPGDDERGLLDRARLLAPVIQTPGAAFLLEGNPEIVAGAGADGAHFAGVDALRSTAANLQPERIVGCGGLKTRHDAMLAGEAGADYVLLGEPDRQGRRPSFAAVMERVAWWAELFEVPCVGYAASLAEVDLLGRIGADFVAVGDCIFADARGPAAALADAVQRLSLTETVG